MADKVPPELAVKAPIAVAAAASAAAAVVPAKPCGVLRAVDESTRLELLKSVMTTAAVLESIGKRHVAIAKQKPIQKLKPEKKREMIAAPEKVTSEERQTLDEVYTDVPELKEYEDVQNKQRHTDPYVLDTTVFAPQSRKAFSTFIDKEYHTFQLQKQTGALDQEACNKLGKSMEAGVQSFLYQQFVREYMRNNSPYRGMLVYHGLGSGKTCSSIAAA
jgi:hypothetical protein